MIPILTALRREANALMNAEGFSNGRPFLRRAALDAYLLVTDAPLRLTDPDQIKTALTGAGLLAADGDKLWHLDAPSSWYAEAYQTLAKTVPQIPDDDALLPLYHLCRVLLKHPSPINEQPLFMVRTTIKAMEAGEKAMLALSYNLPLQLAVLMRKKMALPSLAGRLISLWLNEHSKH